MNNAIPARTAVAVAVTAAGESIAGPGRTPARYALRAAHIWRLNR